MKFLIYKIYRIALTQEKSVGTTFAFLMYLSVFEILHLVILGIKIKELGYSFIIPEKGNFISIIIVCLLCIFNYLFFVRNKLIYRIDKYYQDKNLKAWKGNLIFTVYIVFLFFLLFL